MLIIVVYSWKPNNLNFIIINESYKKQ